MKVRIFGFFLFLAIQVPALGALAQLSLMGAPIAVSVDDSGQSTRLRSWMSHIQQHPSAGTQCAGVAEVPGTLLCLSPRAEGMNRIFARASTYVEGLGRFQRGEVIPQSELNSHEVRSIGGHDLQAKDILNFFSDAEVECRQAPPVQKSNICFNEGEEALRDFILPELISGRIEVVIAASVTTYPIEVISHEVLHAQYFTNTEYRDVVDQYWQDEMLETNQSGAIVLTAEAQEILDILSVYYEVDATPEGQLLLKNEFQAYILMSGAEQQLLADYVSPHRQKLLGLLAQRQEELVKQGTYTGAVLPVQVH